MTKTAFGVPNLREKSGESVIAPPQANFDHAALDPVLRISIIACRDCFGYLCSSGNINLPQASQACDDLKADNAPFLHEA